jgi:hypothetical protein
MIPNLWSAAFSAKFRGRFSNGSENSRNFVASSANTASAWVQTLSSPLRSRRPSNGCISYSDKLASINLQVLLFLDSIDYEERGSHLPQ